MNAETQAAATRALREHRLRVGLFVCYECKADNCAVCIGIPCHCPCPIPEPAPTDPEFSI